MKLIYIAGPYRGARPIDVKRNIRRAEELGELAAEAGFFPVIPHALTAFMDGLQPDEFFLRGTLQLLHSCDGVWLVKGWRKSAGARAEVAEAHRLHMPVHECVGDGRALRRLFPEVKA